MNPKLKSVRYRMEFARAGGKARAAGMTKEARSEAARTAVKARWAKWRAKHGQTVAGFDSLRMGDVRPVDDGGKATSKC